MRVIFLIFCFFLKISLVDSGSEPGGADSWPEEPHEGLHWDGISGVILRNMFAQQSGSSGYSNSNTYYGNNGYSNQAPIYGSAGYTSGQVNQVRTIQTGQYRNYNGYSSNYWTCVNNYRGQYYYSYTYNDYVCDTRANRNGK